jgi:hypothetical protein
MMQVGQLYTGQYGDIAGLRYRPAELDDPGDDKIDIGVIPVIGNGQGSVSPHHGPSHELRWNQFPVAEYGMHM